MNSCDTNQCHHLWLGLVAFVIGAVILLQKFDIVPETTWGWLWPSILVVMGLKFMLWGNCSSSDCCESTAKSDCCSSNTCCDEVKPKKKTTKKKTTKKKSTKKKTTKKKK